MNIPITKPLLGPEESDAVSEVLQSGWIVQGAKVQAFESQFAEHTNTAHCIATTSCTTSLHIAVAALGLKPGDEVIVPAFTWISTANVVEYMGATPVFCDINLNTFNIDVASAESVVSDKTVGIIPVHLFGLAADMTAIMRFAEKHNLWVVEDAACGFGASYQGKHVGSFGEFGCFSFHPRKSITTGEGGIISTNDEKLSTLCRCLRDHGASRTDAERHKDPHGFLLPEFRQLGFNYRMTDIQAAIGCEQLKRANAILMRRRALAKRYDTALSTMPWLRPSSFSSEFEHGYQSYVCLYKPEEIDGSRIEELHQERNKLMQALQERGVATRQGTHAAALQGFYHDRYGITEADVPRSNVAEKLSISLPLYPQMTDSEQDFVIESLHGLEIP